MSSTSRYDSILLEAMSHDLKIVVEAVGSIQDYMRTLATNDELRVVADDVRIMKSAVMETNRELQSHYKRITKLERKVFE